MSEATVERFYKELEKITPSLELTKRDKDRLAVARARKKLPTFELLSFRAVLFRMVPKREVNATFYAIGFRAVLFILASYDAFFFS